MKFEITKASDWNYRETKEIKTLDELLQFIRENGACVIGRVPDYANWSDGQSDPPEKCFALEIYDDYLE